MLNSLNWDFNWSIHVELFLKPKRMVCDMGRFSVRCVEFGHSRLIKKLSPKSLWQTYMKWTVMQFCPISVEILLCIRQRDNFSSTPTPYIAALALGSLCLHVTSSNRAVRARSRRCPELSRTGFFSLNIFICINVNAMGLGYKSLQHYQWFDSCAICTYGKCTWQFVIFR